MYFFFSFSLSAIIVVVMMITICQIIIMIVWFMQPVMEKMHAEATHNHESTAENKQHRI